MYVNPLICNPRLASNPGTVGEQLIALYATPTLVVADNDHLARQLAVAEPELVADQEPTGVVGDIEFAPCCAWVGCVYLVARYIELHMSIPVQLRYGVSTKGATDGGCDSKIGRG